MADDFDKFEDLPPEKARFVLAETKLKLMNLMSHLEFLEAKLSQRSDPRRRTQTLEHQNALHFESHMSSNPIRE
jgi:hypothetical protein